MIQHLSLYELKTLIKSGVHEAMREREQAMVMTLLKLKDEREQGQEAEDRCNAINYGRTLPTV